MTCGYTDVVKTDTGYQCSVCGAKMDIDFTEMARHLLGQKEFEKLERERKEKEHGRRKS